MPLCEQKISFSLTKRAIPFHQIVTDVFSPLCIRFSGEDRSRMKTLLDEYEINLKNVFGQQHKISTKKNIIDMAKELPTYFAR